MALDIQTKRQSKLGLLYNNAKKRAVQEEILNTKKRLTDSTIVKSPLEDRLIFTLNEMARLEEEKKELTVFSPLQKAAKKESIHLCIKEFLEISKLPTVTTGNPTAIENTSIWIHLNNPDSKKHATVYWKDIGSVEEKLQDAYTKISPKLKQLLNNIQITGINLPNIGLLDIFYLGKIDLKGLMVIPQMPDLSINVDITITDFKYNFTIPSLPNYKDIIAKLQQSLPSIDVGYLKNLFSYLYILKYTLTVELPNISMKIPDIIDVPKLADINLNDLYKDILDELSLQLKVPKIPIPDIKIPVTVSMRFALDIVSDLVLTVPGFPLGVVKNVRRIYKSGKKAYKNYASSRVVHLNTFKMKYTSELHKVLSNSLEKEYQRRAAVESAQTVRSAVQLATMAVPVPGVAAAVGMSMSIANYSFNLLKFASDMNDFKQIRDLLNRLNQTTKEYPKLGKFVDYPALSCCILTELDEAAFVTAIVPTGKKEDNNNPIIKELDSIIAARIRDVKISEKYRKEIVSKLFKEWFGSLKEEATKLKDKMPYYVATTKVFDNVYEIIKEEVEGRIKELIKEDFKGRLDDENTVDIIEQAESIESPAAEEDSDLITTLASN